MKVRHKRHKSAVYEIKEESENYYIAMKVESEDCKWGPCLITKCDYEPIPSAPTYRDVTAECEVDEYGCGSLRVWHISNDGKSYIDPLQDCRYRLRKVRDGSGEWCFKVEKRND